MGDDAFQFVVKSKRVEDFSKVFFDYFRVHPIFGLYRDGVFVVCFHFLWVLTPCRFSAGGGQRNKLVDELDFHKVGIELKSQRIRVKGCCLDTPSNPPNPTTQECVPHSRTNVTYLVGK